MKKKDIKQTQSSNQKKKRINKLNDFAKYSSLSFQMIFIVMAGVFAGIYLDKWIAWKFPLFTMLLSIAGIVLAIYYAIKDFLKK
jgi:F0F1-type ATP synthase assembly protein I